MFFKPLSLVSALDNDPKEDETQKEPPVEEREQPDTWKPPRPPK